MTNPEDKDQLQLNEVLKTNIPLWLLNEPHEIYFRYNCFVTSIPRVNNSRQDLAITAIALLKYPKILETMKSFDDYLEGCIESYTGHLFSPNSYPNQLIKLDLWGAGIETIQKLEEVANLSKRITASYIFKPIENYWAFDKLLCMEKIELKIPSNEEENQVRILGRKDLKEDVLSLGLPIKIDPNDVLYRGLSEDKLPIFSLVDIAL